MAHHSKLFSEILHFQRVNEKKLITKNGTLDVSKMWINLSVPKKQWRSKIIGRINHHMN